MSTLPDPASSTAVPAVVVPLEQRPEWRTASPQERAVLQRIAAQRERLKAAKSARVQAQTLRAQQQFVPADAPLMERVSTFVRLHPVASAAVAGVALMVGPRKLLRVASPLIPMLLKLRR